MSQSPDSQPLRLAVFDCDGTLVDSQFLIVGAMTNAWLAHGLGEPDPQAVRRVIGLPLVRAIATLLPGSEDERLHESLAESYKDAFTAIRAQSDQYEPLFPGIRDALDQLEAEGVLLGIATGKSRRGLVAVLEHHGLLERFVTLQTSDIGPGKPHPDMVLRALAETGVDPADAVVIGDTTYDIQMARAAKVATVGVSWGYHELAELERAGADRIVHYGRDTAEAVLALLGKNVFGAGLVR
jgi:phosphoglycolate phosphatase